MALGTLSSLGLGSKVLNHDVIDKLREADEASLIKPIDKKIEQNVEKQTELVAITSTLRDLKSSTSKLGDYSTYLGRSSNVIGDALKANISAGVPTQDIKIDIDSVATSDINEIGSKYESRESVFSQKDSVLKFHHKGHDYKIDIKAGMQLGEVAQLITDTTKGEVMGIVMKTGGSNPYQLMINSKDTGESSRIYFGSTTSGSVVPSGAFSVNDGDLNITLKDKKGIDKTLSIKLPKTAIESKSQDNAEALKEAIITAIKNDSDFDGLLDNDINIGIGGANSDTLTLNDRRGYSIELQGSKAQSLGFGTENKNNAKEDLMVATKSVGAGKLTGTINIGSIPLDLSTLTKEKNTSAQNAKNIAEAINNIAGIYGSVNDEGKLVINSDTGEVNIYANDDPASKKALEDLGLKAGTTMDYAKTQEELFKIRKVQKAEDAKFSYNGISMKRPTNNVDDIVSGVNIEFLTTTEPGKPAVISITRNDEEIIENVKKFVESYNDLALKLDDVTRYDEDSKIAGVFNGNSDIRMIRPSLNRIFSTTIQTETELKGLAKYGLTLNEKGTMTLDVSKLQMALSSDPEGTQELFNGSLKTTEFKEVQTDGVFKKFDQEIDRLLNGPNARLKVLEESLTKDDKKLREDRKKAVEQLNIRYDIMAQRFAAYDSQISKTNNAFSSVQLMIDQSVAKK
ncbi:flagellar filament capping protein FliD [Helicobacter hepaticus]|mgnify:CR=1 FL=1|jgi:flagellar hook-associated protein 2|uniref:Flagellar hook-associated protein 2 n=1 Tax=Helicobacter hepaticus (strain ATCC 51449 / 3B1) TaxID=235279 RepID=Q7VI19_HELHP|nr:flagellar filament capping protein FliD [Helicobacter hepaticus]AAP77387.1 flagellar filament capping protein FliD [Helicobacter hepaticus ATCC 51449]